MLAHLIAAWEQYLKDHDHKQLIEAASTDPHEQEAFQLLMWQGIIAHDWELMKAIESNYAAFFDDDFSNGLMHEAVTAFGDTPDLEAIEWLLSHGARIDGRGCNDWTALHRACNLGHLNMVKVLVKHGAEVNARTSVDGGWTPLMQACVSGNKDIVEFLLAHGADSEIVNMYGEGTARDIARKMGHREVAALLDTNASAQRQKRQRKRRVRRRRKRPEESE